VIGAPRGSLLALGDAALCSSADGSALPQTAQVAAARVRVRARVQVRARAWARARARARAMARGQVR